LEFSDSTPTAASKPVFEQPPGGRRRMLDLEASAEQQEATRFVLIGRSHRSHQIGELPPSASVADQR
jgi:hypothetical protein